MRQKPTISIPINKNKLNNNNKINDIKNILNQNEIDLICDNKLTCKCLLCNKVFASRYYLLLHKKICLFSKNNNNNKNNNNDIKINKPETIYCCSYENCNKSFKQRKTWKQHIKRHTKPFKCEICNKKFGSSYDLNIHGIFMSYFFIHVFS